MFRLFLLSAVLFVSLLSPCWSYAQVYCPAGPQGWRPVSYAEKTVDNLTPMSIDISQLPAAPTNLAMALVSTEDATVRFVFSGVPTSTKGHELAPGTDFFLCGRAMIEAFRAIRTSTGSQNALVHISLFLPL